MPKINLDLPTMAPGSASWVGGGRRGGGRRKGEGRGGEGADVPIVIHCARSLSGLATFLHLCASYTHTHTHVSVTLVGGVERVAQRVTLGLDVMTFPFVTCHGASKRTEQGKIVKYGWTHDGQFWTLMNYSCRSF